MRILITGVSSDLGSALAAELGKDPGIHILGTTRRPKEELPRFLSEFKILDRCDLTKPDCCAKVAATASEEFAGPFGFVHSVGEFWDHVPFLAFDAQRAAEMLESHVSTFYNTLQALVPVMQQKGGASTIAFSCSSVRYNYPWMASFTAAKSAVESLVTSMANEFSGDKLRFNCLVLSSLKTAKVHASKPHGDFEHFTPPADIAPVVRFLLSDDAYLVNGNAIRLLSHSDQFYKVGYFDRVSR